MQPLTVGQLIEKLKDLPKDLVVVHGRESDESYDKLWEVAMVPATRVEEFKMDNGKVPLVNYEPQPRLFYGIRVKEEGEDVLVVRIG
jgi:hypothetical protein